jgi:GTP-binding protein Era
LTNVSETFKSGFVAVAGRTNVGKSTLLNQLLGRKVSIISDKVQTTRNKIVCVLTKDDCQVVFLDTPGVHKPKHKLGEHLVQVALKALNDVDAILLMVEANHSPGPGDSYMIRQLAGVTVPVALVINKIDLIRREELLPLMEKYAEMYSFADIIPVSAQTGENTDYLLEVVTGYLPFGPKYYPDEMVTDRPENFIVGELIREKVLTQTAQEIPHAVAVVIEEMTEMENQILMIRAMIYTEKDSQKGILIGKGGQMLKKIGTLARVDIEKLLGTKVFLELRVKTRQDWRNNKSQIKNLGYYER